MASKDDHKEDMSGFKFWKEACEVGLGITFIDWQAFVLFCFLTEEGKAYYKTLPTGVMGRMISTSAMIDQGRRF